ncbi:MAG: hypothetical protein V7L26_21885 [Nostoc sp.]
MIPKIKRSWNGNTEFKSDVINYAIVRHTGKVVAYVLTPHKDTVVA